MVKKSSDKKEVGAKTEKKIKEAKIEKSPPKKVKSKAAEKSIEKPEKKTAKAVEAKVETKSIEKKEAKPAVEKESAKKEAEKAAKPAEKPKEEKRTARPEKIKKVKKRVLIEKIKFPAGSLKPKTRLQFSKKKKKPRFMRQDLPRIKKLKDVWRTPRGIDSKKRMSKKGKGEIPKVGYGNPKKIRGVHKSGFYPIRISNVGEMMAINREREAAIIASQVGRRKRNEIIKKANEFKIVILNPKKGELIKNEPKK